MRGINKNEEVYRLHTMRNIHLRDEELVFYVEFEN